MKPRKRITRRVPLPRGKPPRARKKDPAKRRWAKHRNDEFRKHLKTLPCCITKGLTGEWTMDWRRHWQEARPWIRVFVDPAHTRPRSLGADDLYECIPLARHLHEEQERIGWPAFEKKYGIDRKALAKKYTAEFLAGFPAYEAGAPTE